MYIINTIISWIGFLLGLSLAIIGLPIIFIGTCLEIGRTIVQRVNSEMDKQEQYKSM